MRLAHQLPGRWHLREMRLSWALRFGIWATLAAQTDGQDATDGQTVVAGFAAAGFKTTTECRVSLQNMIFDENWMIMNQTFTNWCRMKAENKMATCCTNAEWSKGRADACDADDCIADCIFTRMIEMCDAHFGKACTIIRVPFSANGVSFKIQETFCVPADCDNSDDLADNLLIKWYDAQYKYQRTSVWQKDYGNLDEDMVCPSATVLIIVSVVVSIVVILLSIPVAIFLFKAPKERGRVLQGVDEDHEHDQPDDPDAVEALDDGFGDAPPAIGDR
jgi:hypothetical protein